MKGQNGIISFHFQKPCTLKERTRLRAFIAGMFRRYKTPFQSLDIIFCSDSYLLDINRQYLQHDYYTDIITFNLAGTEDHTVGEIYISVDRVRENAVTNETGLMRELHRVMFHGVLHLCGFDDKTPEQKRRMTKAEDRELTRYLGG